ncbi:MAG TPA: hypothetical protein EYP80_01660 [Candidatus Aenigmarchaeota archaeon]|nr:hypothetical protein [Candidatus Aenigmarchaeota archaeon]
MNLVDEEGKCYANYIYDDIHLRIAKSLLKRDISEGEFIELVRKFFKSEYRYEGGDLTDKSLQIIKYVNELRFDRLDEFKLIKEEPTESVFIEQNEDAHTSLLDFTKVYEAFRNARREDLFHRRADLRLARAKLEAYIVNVRERDISKKLPPDKIVEELPIWLIPRYCLEEYYDGETGYRRNPIYPAVW